MSNPKENRQPVLYKLTYEVLGSGDLCLINTEATDKGNGDAIHFIPTEKLCSTIRRPCEEFKNQLLDALEPEQVEPGDKIEIKVS